MKKIVLFDVANTLLWKPDFYGKLQEFIKARFDFDVSLDSVIFHHKFASEMVVFPDKTTREFYLDFNLTLLLALGLPASHKDADDFFNLCRGAIKWQPYSDTRVLDEMQLPLGIVSNWNYTLERELKPFGNVFSAIFCSEVVGLRKPSKAFYQHVLDSLGLNPSDILYIGDSMKLDYSPATELGIQTLIIDRHNFYSCKHKAIISDLNQVKNYL